jgi:RNA polymerase sigma-70 factor (ECF subfamily)
MQLQPPSDKDALGGDEFETAYRQFGPEIYRFLYWRTGDRMTSEDLMTDVFEHAWKSRRSFHGGSLRAWLYRITRNLLIDYWRKVHDIPLADADNMAEPVADASEFLDISLTLQRLHGAILALPAAMRDVVQMRFIEGMTARQVAGILHMSESNVRVTQYRALIRLRRSM